MKILQNTIENMQIPQFSKHPFHVLTSSRLPIIISILVGIIANVFVSKLHDVT